MSSQDAINLEFGAATPVTGLRQRLRAMGVPPFHQQVIQSPWSVVYDAEGLYADVKGLIAQVVGGCGQKDVVRCLTVIAPPGYGKTHLLAWNRQRLEQSKSAVFAYVPPYSPDAGPFENHVLRAVLDALSLHSPWQTQLLGDSVLSFLTETYDGYVEAGRPLDRLRTGTFWSRLLRRLSHRVGGRGRDEQLAALRRAFRYPDLLRLAFAHFEEAHPAGPEGLRPDWDTFVAAALFACGDPAQRYHAKQWLCNEPMPPEVYAPYHIRQRCQGVDKVRDGLFTLTRLAGKPLCLAFDQFEDSCNAVLKHPAPPWGALTLLLTRLSAVPGFSLLFFVQASVWQELASKIPRMLYDRITDSHHVQRLRSLDDEAARAVVQARMGGFVWCALAAEGILPPADRPLFPFTEAEVRQLRIDANSELRPFLRLLNERYAQLIAPPAPSPPVITEVVPDQVPPHEPNAVRIRGRHFRPEVCVSLAGQPVGPVTYHPNEGATEVIEIVTPVGLLGDVELRVQAADDPTSFATARLCFVDPVPRPYHANVDRQKMKQRRLELGLNQTQLGGEVGASQKKISDLENGRWHPPDDDVERIAAALGRGVADFRKDGPGGGK